MDTIGCFKKSGRCFRPESMLVTHTEMNGNRRQQLAGSPGLAGAAQFVGCVPSLFGFRCWLRAERDVVMASVSSRLEKQGQCVLYFTNKKSEKENKVARRFPC